MLLREHRTTTRSFNEAERTAEFVCSTEAIDSYDSIVEQDWDLKRFADNPIALFNHRSDSPIGTWFNVGVEGKALVGTLRIAEGTKAADECFTLLKQGVLRGASVGFTPKSYDFETVDGREVLVYSENELFEISVVSVPANPEAVARQAKLAREHATAARKRRDESANLQRLNALARERAARTGEPLYMALSYVSSERY